MISGEDALLLQYLYTWESSTISAVTLLFAAEYGLSIATPVLRYALLAYAAHSLCRSTAHFQTASEQHKSRATQLLIHALETPKTLTEAEIFAADLMARVSYPEKVTVHAQGIRSMLSTVERFRAGRPLFKVMRGWVSTTTRGFGAPISPERIRLENIIEMWTQLHYTVPRGLWNSSLAEGLADWLTLVVDPTMKLLHHRVLLCQRVALSRSGAISATATSRPPQPTSSDIATAIIHGSAWA